MLRAGGVHTREAIALREAAELLRRGEWYDG